MSRIPYRLRLSTTTSPIFTSTPLLAQSSGLANTFLLMRVIPTRGPKVANFRSRIVDHHIAAVNSADSPTTSSAIAGDIRYSTSVIIKVYDPDYLEISNIRLSIWISDRLEFNFKQFPAEQMAVGTVNSIS